MTLNFDIYPDHSLDPGQPLRRKALSVCFPSLLYFRNYNVFNLFLQVRQKPVGSEEMVDELSELLQTRFSKQSGIIYSLTIKDAELLSVELRKRDIRVLPYHATLSAEERQAHYGSLNYETNFFYSNNLFF